MTKALVTGGLGFIGSHVVDLLISMKWEVLVVDNLVTGDKANSNPKASYLYKDVKDLTPEEVSDFDYVFHLAALARIQPSFDQPEEHEIANVIVTIRLLESLKGSKRLRKLVYSASSSCYGDPKNFPTTEFEQINPLSPYALQKYAAEQYCFMLGERNKLPVNTLRYFNAYGPRSYNPNNKHNAYTSVIGIFANQKSNKQSLTITGNGMQKRDFVHAFDIAHANYLAAVSEIKGECFNVGYGTCYSILEIAKMFNHPYVFIPERLGEAQITHASIEKASRLLGWKPQITIEDGIQSYS